MAGAGPVGGNVQQVDPEMGSLYDRPELYEAAFSYREIEKEVIFLQEMYAAKAGGQPLKSVLDMGCGTARHLRGLAAAGVACQGLDLNKSMLEFAAKEAKREGVELQLSQGDMRGYVPTEGAELVDMACILMGTLQHMLTNEDVIATAQAAKGAIRPGGLLVIELAHPYDLWDGTLAGAEDYPEIWDADLDEDSKLYIEWGREGDPFDGLSQVLERTVCATVTKKDKHVMTIMDICQMRQFSMQELRLVAHAVGMEVVGVYGEMNMAIELDDDEAYRLVMVLRK